MCTYQYMHLYSMPNTNQIHTQYIPSMYWMCIELSIQTLEFNTNQYILGKPLMLLGRCGLSFSLRYGGPWQSLWSGLPAGWPRTRGRHRDRLARALIPLVTMARGGRSQSDHLGWHVLQRRRHSGWLLHLLDCASGWLGTGNH